MPGLGIWRSCCNLFCFCHMSNSCVGQVYVLCFLQSASLQSNFWKSWQHVGAVSPRPNLLSELRDSIVYFQSNSQQFPCYPMCRLGLTFGKHPLDCNYIQDENLFIQLFTYGSDSIACSGMQLSLAYPLEVILVFCSS